MMRDMFLSVQDTFLHTANIKALWKWKKDIDANLLIGTTDSTVCPYGEITREEFTYEFDKGIGKYGILLLSSCGNVETVEQMLLRAKDNHERNDEKDAIVIWWLAFYLHCNMIIK
jgi:hypothetical protein